MVEVPEVFPEGCDHHGTKVIQFLIQNCMCKSIISSYFLIQMVHDEVHEVGVVVHEGVLDQHGTVLEQFCSKL